jgi:hypothetical protein
MEFASTCLYWHWNCGFSYKTKVHGKEIKQVHQVRQTPLSFFNKKTKISSLTITCILFLSIFISLLNVNPVNASYGTEITGQTFNGWDSQEGNSYSDGTYNVFATDKNNLV